MLFDGKMLIPKLFLPIGISFYTFQSISYIVDVYNKQIESTKKFIDYMFYMTFFPHLVAGPIVRARDFISQINLPININKEIFKESLYRIISGLAKKLLTCINVAACSAIADVTTGLLWPSEVTAIPQRKSR